MKTRLKIAAIAVAVATYAGSALAPSSVSAQATSVAGTSGAFVQETGTPNVAFIHITVADILHNNPCQPTPTNTAFSC